MIFLWVILASVIVATFLIPIKIVVYGKLKGDNVYSVDNLKEKNDIIIIIKLLGFLPVYKYDNKKNNSNDESNNLTITDILEVLKKAITKKEFKLNEFTKKVFNWGKRIKFKKLVLIGGFNTEDYVKNAYINASINSIICMFINANQENFNLKKLYYQVSISDYKYYLTLDTVFAFPVISNMDIIKTIINIVHKFKKKKEEKNLGSSNSQRENKQVNTCVKV